jgi:hypothetical protein
MEYFWEIKIIAQSQRASAIADVYVTQSEIVELANSLISFPQKEDSEIRWSAPGEDEPLRFHIFQKDRLGHVLVEVYALIDDGVPEKSNHSTCFYVATEIGLLNTFGHRLLSIDRLKLGTRISLIDDDE